MAAVQIFEETHHDSSPSSKLIFWIKMPIAVLTSGKGIPDGALFTDCPSYNKEVKTKSSEMA